MQLKLIDLRQKQNQFEHWITSTLFVRILTPASTIYMLADLRFLFIIRIHQIHLEVGIVFIFDYLGHHIYQ